MPKRSGLMYLLLQTFPSPSNCFSMNHFIPNMHGLIQTLKKPFPCKINEHANPRGSYLELKIAFPCCWLIFQINLELYFIFSISENSQCSFNWKNTNQISVFHTIPIECIRNLRQYIFHVAYKFCTDL